MLYRKTRLCEAKYAWQQELLCKAGMSAICSPMNQCVLRADQQALPPDLTMKLALAGNA
ncbi:hypothetical protein [Trueperella sp. LYQ143]|uniref:hypothetical protein n=1 Tax=unclassified Trueperella TaxID=2630174 RepID=UPI003982DEFC